MGIFERAHTWYPRHVMGAIMALRWRIREGKC